MVDLFIIIVLLWAAFTGWRDGMLKQVVSAVGFFVGFFIAATCYSTLGQYLSVSGTSTNVTTSIIAFFLLWIIVPILLGFIAKAMTKGLQVICLGWFNRLLGAAISIVKYLILLSCVLNVMSVLHILDEQKTQDSYLFEPTRNFIAFALHKTIAHYDEEKKDAKNDTVWVDMRKAQPAHENR